MSGWPVCMLVYLTLALALLQMLCGCLWHREHCIGAHEHHVHVAHLQTCALVAPFVHAHRMHKATAPPHPPGHQSRKVGELCLRRYYLCTSPSSTRRWRWINARIYWEIIKIEGISIAMWQATETKWANMDNSIGAHILEEDSLHTNTKEKRFDEHANYCILSLISHSI